MPKFMTLASILYPVFASTPTTPDYVDASDWSKVITNVVGQFSVANIVAVIASVVLAGIVGVEAKTGYKILASVINFGIIF